MDSVEKFLSALKSAHPDNEWLYMNGQCYALFRILRTVWPDAKPMYSMLEGHVYTEIDGRFYDIRGKHLSPPKDLSPLNHQRGHKPHRWGKSDTRRLVETARYV